MNKFRESWSNWFIESIKQRIRIENSLPIDRWVRKLFEEMSGNLGISLEQIYKPPYLGRG